MEAIAFCMLMVQKISIQSKWFQNRIKSIAFRFQRASKHFTVDNMKKAGLDGYMYDFSVNFNTVYVSDIVDIHKYLMEKHNIK